jgi:hypothetical protein
MMVRMLRAAVIVLSITLCAPPLAHASIIVEDHGGYVPQYAARYRLAAITGETFEIHRACMSACTLITGMVPRGNVCAEPGAILVFHSAYVPTTGQHAPEGTRFLWEHYPPDVRRALRRAGWNGAKGGAHRKLIVLPARRFYRSCR